MAIIDIRGTGNDLAQTLSTFGHALRRAFESEESKIRRFLVNNPQLAQQISTAGWIAMSEQPPASAEGEATIEGEGTARTVKEPAPQQFGVFPPKLVHEAMRLFPPDPQQVLAYHMVKGGVPQKTVEATGLELEGQTRQRRAELSGGAPEAQARATIERARAETETAALQRETAQAARSQNIPQLQAEVESARLKLSRNLTTQESQELVDYVKFVNANGLQGVAGVARHNPTLLNYLLSQQQMAIEERLAMLRNARDPLEVAVQLFKLKKDVNQELDDLVKRIREADAAGDKTLIPSLVGRINDLARFQMQAFPEDVATTAKLMKGIFGVAGVEFDPAFRREIEIMTASQQIASGQKSIEDLERSRGFSKDEKVRIIELANQIRQQSMPAADDETWSRKLINKVGSVIKNVPSLLQNNTLTLPPFSPFQVRFGAMPALLPEENNGGQ